MQILRLLVLGLSIAALLLAAPQGAGLADAHPVDSAEQIDAADALDVTMVPPMYSSTAAAVDGGKLAGWLPVLLLPLLSCGYISLSLKEQLRRRGFQDAPRDQQYADLLRMPPGRKSQPAAADGEKSPRS